MTVEIGKTYRFHDDDGVIVTGKVFDIKDRNVCIYRIECALTGDEFLLGSDEFERVEEVVPGD